MSLEKNLSEWEIPPVQSLRYALHSREWYRKSLTNESKCHKPKLCRWLPNISRLVRKLDGQNQSAHK